ncbi:hypothetical protein [Kitasatospora sp. LaBMicrA B282]|uniref:hypothetical protein n=1 Tax=Kitasatospora sp. LaBMicrA B282 TaxID=3420949 RepID=UPI003D0CD1F2
MTVPNSSPDTPGAADEPHGAPDTPAPSDWPLPIPEAPPTPWRRLSPELLVGAPILGACLVLGVLMGAMWFWLAPEVPLVVHGQSVLYVDPEGEQAAGADSVFVLLGLGFGLVAAAGAFWRTRQRGGGIVVAGVLTAGGLAASWIAWQLGVLFGPTGNIVAHAKQVGDGHTFNEALALGAKGALLAWPMASLVLLLALTATFGKREQDPPPYWAGPAQPSADGAAVAQPAGAEGVASSSPLPAPSPEPGPDRRSEGPSGAVVPPPSSASPAAPAEAVPSAPADLGADGPRQAQ